eukprot:ANDGO_04171.mRNA.1 Coiled-coil domain-containing protein 42 homolog
MSRTMTETSAFLTQPETLEFSSSANRSVPFAGRTPAEKLENSRKRVSVTTKLADKRNEMEEVDMQIKAKITEFESCLVAWRSREEVLRKRQRDFQQLVEAYRQEQPEHEMRVIRAVRKYEEACKQRDAKHAEIKEMTALLENLKLEKKKKEEERMRILCYQEFLNNVLEYAHGGSFNEIADIIRRHETLKNTGMHLASRIEEDRAQIEEIKAHIQKYTVDKQTQVLISNKEIAHKNQELEQIRLDADREEHLVERNRESSNQTSALLGQLRMAIVNLYARCKTKHYGSLDASTDLIKAIEVIGSRLSDLLFVTTKASQGALPNRRETLLANPGPPAKRAEDSYGKE